jgi:hypothetical protein
MGRATSRYFIRSKVIVQCTVTSAMHHYQCIVLLHPCLTPGYGAPLGHDVQLPALALGLVQVTMHHALGGRHNPLQHAGIFVTMG